MFSFFFAESDFTLSRDFITLGEFPETVTVTLLDDREANEPDETVVITLEERDPQDADGEFLLDVVTISITDLNGQQRYLYKL